MHHALAVPTANGASHPGGGGVRRLSIHSGPTRVDLVLSAATPIGLQIPPIVDILTRSNGFCAGPISLSMGIPVWFGSVQVRVSEVSATGLKLFR